MKTAAIAIAATMVFSFGAVLAAPDPSKQPTGMTWTGPITKGGENVTINGTIGSIYAEVIRRNPNFHNDLGAENESNAGKCNIINPINWDSLRCLDDRDGGEVGDVNTSIRQLRRLSGNCGFGDGIPASGWSVLECQWDGGVAVGNYHFQRNLWISCSDIADNAEGILSTCLGMAYRGFIKNWKAVSHGEISSFDGNWGVRVLQTSCIA